MISKRTKNIISKTLMSVMLSSMTLNGVSQIVYAQEVTQENVYESSPMIEHADNEIVAESDWEGQTWVYEEGKRYYGDKPMSQVTYGDLLKVERLSVTLNWTHKQGHIPRTIRYFKNLKYFSLGGTKFEGYIPEELYELKNLETLEIYDNKHIIGGEISPKIGNLTKLRYLNLSNNQFN